MAFTKISDGVRCERWREMRSYSDATVTVRILMYFWLFVLECDCSMSIVRATVPKNVVTALNLRASTTLPVAGPSLKQSFIVISFHDHFIPALIHHEASTSSCSIANTNSFLRHIQLSQRFLSLSQGQVCRSCSPYSRLSSRFKDTLR
jgi:hypothetical protein